MGDVYEKLKKGYLTSPNELNPDRLTIYLDSYNKGIMKRYAETLNFNEIEFIQKRLQEIDSEIEDAWVAFKREVANWEKSFANMIREQFKVHPTGLSSELLGKNVQLDEYSDLEIIELYVSSTNDLRRFPTNYATPLIYERAVLKIRESQISTLSTGEAQKLDLKVAHKVRYLHSLGIIEFLKGQSSEGRGVSVSDIAHLVAEFTGSNYETIKRALTAIDANEKEVSKNPIMYKSEMEKVEKKIRHHNLKHLK